MLCSSPSLIEHKTALGDLTWGVVAGTLTQVGQTWTVAMSVGTHQTTTPSPSQTSRASGSHFGRVVRLEQLGLRLVKISLRLLA